MPSLLDIPVQRTWSVGDIATAAQLNANVRDSINFLLNVPLFEGSQTTVQSLATSTPTPVAYDTNQIDTYSGHSTTVNNSRYVAQKAGIYLVLGSCGFAINATGQRLVSIYKNGTSQAYQQSLIEAPTANTPILTASGLVQLAVGDYVEVYAFQSSGGALNTYTGLSGFNIIWLHA